MLLTHALLHKKKSPRTYTSMHTAGLELTKLTYTRLEDNPIHHRGDQYYQLLASLHNLLRTWYVRIVLVFYFSRFHFLSSLSLLGFEHWFSFLGGMRIVGFRLTLMGNETGKQNWHALLFFVWPRFVYRVSSFATLLLWCFVHDGISFELGGRWREGVRDAVPPPKGVGFPCSFDKCMILKFVSLLQHQGKDQPQALQCTKKPVRS